MEIKVIAKRENDKVKVITINEFPAIFGRGEECNYQLDETSLSRRHFAVDYHDGRFTVQDMKSTNGTYLNGKEVQVTAAQLQNHFAAYGKEFMTIEEEAVRVRGEIEAATTIQEVAAVTWAF